MSQRPLFTTGVVAIAASVVIGVAGMATSRTGFSMTGFGTSSGQTMSVDPLTLLCLQADARAWLIHAEPSRSPPHAPGHVN